MKVIKINESQKKRLFEAYREGFSLKELSALGNNGWGAQYDYCIKWLGEPNGFGSSRCVFTLSDNIILKLAMGGQYKAGIAQNKQEYEMYKTWDSPLLVRIYNVDKNFTFLISESVVPAEEIDFEQILGLPFYHWVQGSEYGGDGEDIVGYDKYFDTLKKPHEKTEINVYNILAYIESNYAIDEPYYDEEMEKVIKNSEWLSQFRNFVMYTGMSDFCQVENFGIVNRNGKPTLVILDSGLNLDIWSKYYAD